MSSTYPINTPVTFINTAPANEINFQAGGPLSILNKAKNFVVTAGGDILYRAPGANNYLERLAIGTVGNVLTSDGIKPIWQTPSSSTNHFFTAYVTGSASGIPTSRDSGLAPGEWFNLGNTFVVWSTAFPGNDPDSLFDIVTGNFTVPAEGYYSFNASVTFDSGPSVNSGYGLPTASVPSGKACRQVQIYTSAGGGMPLSTVTRQVEAFNDNSTTVVANVVEVLLSIGDTVYIRVRHDRPNSDTVTIGDVLISLPSQTYFSGKKI